MLDYLWENKKAGIRPGPGTEREILKIFEAYGFYASYLSVTSTNWHSMKCFFFKLLPIPFCDDTHKLRESRDNCCLNWIIITVY